MLHPEAKCEELYKEKEYPKEYQLDKMYQMQKELQKFIANKRGFIVPPDNENEVLIWPHIKENVVANATYANLELFNELFYSIGSSIKESKFELIDIAHFCFNILIYSGIKDLKDVNLDELFDKFIAPEDLNFMNLACKLNIAIADYINALPYKSWKSYEDKYEDLIDLIYLNIQKSHIIKAIVNLAKYFNMTKEEFYSYYLCKNEENYNRQLDKSKNYI